MNEVELCNCPEGQRTVRGMCMACSVRKPYTPPKLRKLDPRCVKHYEDADSLYMTHVPNCQCEK